MKGSVGAFTDRVGETRRRGDLTAENAWEAPIDHGWRADFILPPPPDLWLVAVKGCSSLQTVCANRSRLDTATHTDSLDTFSGSVSLFSFPLRQKGLAWMALDKSLADGWLVTRCFSLRFEMQPDEWRRNSWIFLDNFRAHLTSLQLGLVRDPTLRMEPSFRAISFSRFLIYGEAELANEIQDRLLATCGVEGAVADVLGSVSGDDHSPFELPRLCAE